MKEWNDYYRSLDVFLQEKKVLYRELERNDEEKGMGYVGSIIIQIVKEMIWIEKKYGR